MWPLDDNSPPFRAAAAADIGLAGVGSLGRMAIRVDLRKRLVQGRENSCALMLAAWQNTMRP